MNEFRTFYEGLALPWFAPAPEVFGIAWGIIYPLIAIAAVIIFIQAIRGKIPAWITGVFIANIFFNLLFTPVQLVYGLAGATVVILLVLATLLYLQIILWRNSQLAFWLLTPYLLWGTFATILQISLLVLNPGTM